MIKLNIKHTNITASCLETLVEGNVNSIFAEFSFSPEWDALTKIAVFSNGTSKVSVSISDGICAIPWEMLSCPGELLVAVRGIGDGGSLVLCTENATLGKVNESLAGDDTEFTDDATPNVIDTLLADVAELKAGGVTGADGVGITDISKTSTSGKVDTYTISLSDGAAETFTVTNGTNGTNGYTPVKGTDYWTTADIATIKNYVDDAILNGEW